MTQLAPSGVGLAAAYLGSALLFYMPLFLWPLTLALAVLRYRLWDIDVIICRTLIYGTLTGTLGLLYLGSVVLLQAVLHPLIGSEVSPFVTVTSTLALVALFSPLRWHIQIAIDKRFYRRKYDAVKTLAAFSAQMRDEVDLNRLTDDLLAVVRETMQPAHASLWLRPAERQARRERIAEKAGASSSADG